MHCQAAEEGVVGDGKLKAAEEINIFTFNAFKSKNCHQKHALTNMRIGGFGALKLAMALLTLIILQTRAISVECFRRSPCQVPGVGDDGRNERLRLAGPEVALVGLLEAVPGDM